MHKPFPHERVFTIKRKNPSLKSADNLRRSTKFNAKVGNGHKNIPRLINEIQSNLHLLKKYYEQQMQSQQNSQPKFLTRVHSRAQSSNKRKNKQNHEQYQEQTTVPELDDLKKSFLSMHGYESNNIIELYNFYKKNMEKSTRLFGSTSMSNTVNLTHNHSELRQKCVRPGTAYLTSNDESKQKQQKEVIKFQQNYSSKVQSKLPAIHVQTKKTNQMVNVATLLADKKKISRKNICENMNSQNLLNQAKRRLYRPHPTENIQKFSKLKENLKNQNINIRSSPSRKAKNELLKQKSNQKRSNVKEIKEKQSQHKPKQRQTPHLAYKTPCQYLKVPDIQNNSKPGQQQLKIPIILTEEAIIQTLSKKKQQPNTKQKQTKQLKEIKSAKSSRSVKSIKSPPSIRSPSLNQGVILDLTGSCEPSQRKNIHPSYFVPKFHSNLHDSLLDCEITPKQQSRILDLQSIPFDF